MYSTLMVVPVTPGSSRFKADVDDGTIRWVCADLVTHIVLAAEPAVRAGRLWGGQDHDQGP